MKSTIYLALMETRSFSFSAVGASEKEAQDALVAVWGAHRKQFPPEAQAGMPAESLTALDEEFEVTVLPMTLGVGYRDRELVR